MLFVLVSIITSLELKCVKVVALSIYENCFKNNQDQIYIHQDKNEQWIKLFLNCPLGI